jgi:hypothetical protein
MSPAARTRWSRRLARVGQAPPDGRDRGSTTENVIWIAALAALALTVAGLFGQQILDAANRVVFQ